MIHQLKEQGESISGIARRTGLDRKTVRRYLNRGVDKPALISQCPYYFVASVYGLPGAVRAHERCFCDGCYPIVAFPWEEQS